MDKLKKLLEDLAAVVADMAATTETPEGVEPAEMTEEQEASLRSLEQKADKLRSQIELLERAKANRVQDVSVDLPDEALS